jgi:hypothetical protein
MSVETALRVRLPNRPGELSRIASQLARAEVNIRAVGGVAGAASPSESVLEFLVDRPSEASRAWREAGTPFEEVPVALVWLPDEPGTLAKAGAALAEAGINLDSTYIVRTEAGRTQVAFGCADAPQADRLLAALRQE